MKIALHGYGKMGRAVEQAARDAGHEIISTFDRQRRISASLLGGAEVLIDFSNADSLDRVIESACGAKTNLVIGTTGWNDRFDEVQARCVRDAIGVVHGANFSPGANIVFRLAREAAARFAAVSGYAAGIEERHHSQKKDAPSGTALRIAREVNQGSGGKLNPSIAASRAGSEFGLHTLFFDSPEDLVEISHRARGRTGFARGAILAAEKIRGRIGFFSFEELLFEERAARSEQQ